MLNAFPIASDIGKSLTDASWIDFVDPTPTEAAAFEKSFGFQVPTKEELSEIETTIQRGRISSWLSCLSSISAITTPWRMPLYMPHPPSILDEEALLRHDRKAKSDNVTAMNFCAHCDGWLWNDPATPGIKVVRAGTLDDMDWGEPIGNIWTKSKAAWVRDGWPTARYCICRDRN
jgi:hypothetical protein